MYWLERSRSGSTSRKPGCGVTSAVGQRTFLEIEDGDVIDIRIRLPANPADLPTAKIPEVQGAVRGATGDPPGRIGLWVWGGSTDNSKFQGISADGTFGIPHQNGMYVIRIYIWQDEAWRHIGWYGGETGFTGEREQATEIEVDGADVTGIAIHLPADPAELPTAR